MSSREQQAKQIVKNSELWAMGVGVIPVPVVDLVGLTAVQVNMVSQLSRCYGVPLTDNGAKTAIAAILGGFIPTRIAWGGARSLLKAVPVVGPLAAALMMPSFAVASTRIVGRLFVRHFESGGTLLDFDPGVFRQKLRRELEKEEPPEAAPEAAGAEAAGAAGGAKSAGGGDDLTKISGIGPAIARLLRELGIDSFEGLAAASPEDLEAILDRPRFRMHKASIPSWQEQAGQAAGG
jgi:predicted flap endonuclease-1-like 5' DNA nuclease